jgi:phospholipase/lecithinase/hemolysin
VLALAEAAQSREQERGSTVLAKDARRTPRRQRWSGSLSAILLAAACALPGAASAGFSGIYVFGDSLADSGNAFHLNTTSPGLGAALGLLVPANPFTPYPPPGAPLGTTRYTNGNAAGANLPIGVEVLAQSLGFSLLPSTAGGTNYAIGGATTGVQNFAYEAFQIPGTPPVPFYPALQDRGLTGQLAQFQTSLGGGSADPGGLYVVWAGPNDVFLEGAAFDPFDSVANIANAVAALYGMGARYVLVPNMPDLGQTPAFFETPGEGPATAAAQAFNFLLDLALAGLEANPALAGLDVIPFNTYALLNDAIANPGDYGFTNVRDGCLVVGCTDPSTFLFWDEVHPTARAQSIVGAAFAAAVPEPGVLSLLGLAVIAFAIVLRRRPRARR